MIPEFLEAPAVVQSQDTSRLIIDCLVQAKPDPTMQWYFAGNLLESGDRYNMQVKQHGTNFRATLEIKVVFYCKYPQQGWNKCQTKLK